MHFWREFHESRPTLHIALYRHHKAIRTLLGVKAYTYTDAHTREIATDIARRAADMVVTRVDIINIAAEELVRLSHELPAFGALDEIAERAHAEAELALYSRIAQRLSHSLPSPGSWTSRPNQSPCESRRRLAMPQSQTPMQSDSLCSPARDHCGCYFRPSP
ncbi:DUF4158 domain-containing protein [Pandoraea sp. NPDC090278]|uniref:DUF4158 domain-containing protein n=1 Tax=Pandoraea sp. NPDC090278 TaxID=3364391 RepID=UPI00383AD1D1